MFGGFSPFFFAGAVALRVKVATMKERGREADAETTEHDMISTNAMMNNAFNAKNKIVSINPRRAYTPTETRTVLNVRVAYGNAIIWTLDRPLTGKTSTLFYVTPESVETISYV